MSCERIASYILKTALLFYSCVALPAHAQRMLEAYADYSAVPLGDTILLTFRYHGGTPVASFDPHLNDYQVAGGPFQSTSSQMKTSGDSFITTQTTEISYRIWMNKPGSFTIPQAEVKEKNGRVHVGNPVVIEVKEAPFKKVPDNTHPAEDPFKALLGEMQQEGKIQQGMQGASYPYILVTGFVYRRKSENDRTKQTRLAIDSFINSKKKTQYLGTVTRDNMPRNYYSINDTTELRMQLQALYQQEQSHARYAIMIFKKEVWSRNNEYRVFENATSVWAEIDQLTGYMAPARKARLQWEVQFKCLLTAPEDGKALSVFAIRNGYSISSTYNKQAGTYTFLLKKRSDIIPEHLFAMAQELIDETSKYDRSPKQPQTYTGYAGMAIKQVQVQK